MTAILGMLSTKVFIICVILHIVSEKITENWVRKHIHDVAIDRIMGEYNWRLYASFLVKVVADIVGVFALIITVINL